MAKRMLINVLEPEECRIAIVGDGHLEQLYVERESAAGLVGNVYKARVVNVEPSLGAAFVDFDEARNGFLHADDVRPSLFVDPHLARRTREAKPPEGQPIAGMLKRGQELMVQVIKEGMERKAPKVTTFISIPGRYLVVMPEVKRRGVSRKIEDEAERHKLRQMLESLEPPENLGFIVRTAGAAMSRRELRRDMTYLTRLWGDIEKKFGTSKAPCLLYQESDLVIRAVRDIFSHDIEEMLVDSEDEYNKVLDFMRITMPRQRKVVKLYTDPEPLFHKFDLEQEIKKIHERRVPLPGGGGIVIEQTEALVAIDVNSGKYTREATAEETAFRTNLEAAPEIARQIRLRDLGGIIIADFIDMENEGHIREVERALWEGMRGDRARTKMLRMSKFGLVEMTRQRMRPSLRSAAYEPCRDCRGSGHVKTLETMGLEVLRNLKAGAKASNLGRLEATLHPRVAEYMQNEKRRDLLRLEERADADVVVHADPSFGIEQIEIQNYAKDGSKLKGGK